MWAKIFGRNLKHWIIQLILFCLLTWLLLNLAGYYYDEAGDYALSWVKNDLPRNSVKRVDRTGRPFFKPRHKYDCVQLILQPVKSAAPARALLNDVELRTIFSKCETLFEFHYYPRTPLSREEADFPLAYILLVNEHLEQVEILLNTIYQPHNFYCIHVDLKSDLIFFNSLKKLSQCFENVFLVEDPVGVSPVTSSMIHAQVHCLEILTTKDYSWKYLMVLQGHDFPIKTNKEIVEILTIHDGANDVELLWPPHG